MSASPLERLSRALRTTLALGAFLLGGLAIWMAPRPKGPIAAASH